MRITEELIFIQDSEATIPIRKKDLALVTIPMYKKGISTLCLNDGNSFFEDKEAGSSMIEKVKRLNFIEIHNYTSLYRMFVNPELIDWAACSPEAEFFPIDTECNLAFHEEDGKTWKQSLNSGAFLRLLADVIEMRGDESAKEFYQRSHNKICMHLRNNPIKDQFHITDINNIAVIWTHAYEDCDVSCVNSSSSADYMEKTKRFSYSTGIRLSQRIGLVGLRKDIWINPKHLMWKETEDAECSMCPDSTAKIVPLFGELHESILGAVTTEEYAALLEKTGQKRKISETGAVGSVPTVNLLEKEEEMKCRI